MRIKFLFLVLLLCQSVQAGALPKELKIIPRPAELKLTPGSLFLPGTITWFADDSIQQLDFLNFVNEWKTLPSKPGSMEGIAFTKGTRKRSFLRFELAKNQKLPEGYYEMVCDSSGIKICANNPGTFYALQSLLQIFLNHAQGKTLPYFVIRDFPRFSWRGMHLDVSRHFMPIPFIKKYIRQLALHKMNVFHWHLSDDQGWRIEIKKYPGLQNISSMRKESMFGHYNEQKFDGVSHGGFYTQSEIREVVAYAKALKVEIVPEIEMPGHAMAALAAYPELSCTGSSFSTATSWGVFDDVFCTKEPVFNFLQDVLTEIASLFPGTYIHIGGDECPKTRWKVCPSCQENIRNFNLKDEAQLQSWFIGRIEKFLAAKGKKIIGWDEILEGGLAENAAVMSWRGTSGGIAAAKMKHPVVMSPGSHCYFDHYQSDPSRSKIAIGGYNPVNHVYAYEPVPDGLSAEESSYILGAQGNVWTEYMYDFRDVERMAFPRLCALAEVVWTPSLRRDSVSFFSRMFAHEPQLINVFDVQSSLSAFSPVVKASPSADSTGIEISVGSVMTDLFPDWCTCTYSVMPLDPEEKSRSGSMVTYPCSLKTIIRKPVSVAPCIYVKGSTDCMETPVSEDVDVHFHDGCFRKLSAVPPKSPYFQGRKNNTLLDGEIAVLPRRDYQWNAWNQHQVSLTVDMGKTDSLFSISPGFLSDEKNGIFTPDSIIFKISTDSINFSVRKIAYNDIPLRLKKSKKNNVSRPAVKTNIYRPIMKFENSIARFVVLEVYCNSANSTNGEPDNSIPWIFMDEIKIKTKRK